MFCHVLSRLFTVQSLSCNQIQLLLCSEFASVHCVSRIQLEHVSGWRGVFNILKPTGHVMYHQFNIQQLYALPTLYLCVLYLYEN